MAYLENKAVKAGFRLVEYSIQATHLHLICEADNEAALSRAMNGLMSGIARILNRHWNRKGPVFVDRYHAEILKTPSQCLNARRYVLHNARKHGALARLSSVDPYSTAPWFPFTKRRIDRRTDELAERPVPRPDDRCPPGQAKPAAHPGTWILRAGWKRAGPIYHDDHPAIPTQRRSRRV